jgi:BirA family transcriptional regulator, biotin operon repressor / biotin---[acetyl-CoA-carboxylase] ligase
LSVGASADPPAGAPHPGDVHAGGPILGSPRVHLRRTGSTNEHARRLALAGAPHGTLVTAAEQTAVRGRHGRRWSAPAGRSLLMSLLVRSPPRLLPLMAAVAVCDAVGGEAGIKWPNDVLLGAPPGKLAGILIEGRPQERWAVVGIGLNVAVRLDELPPELRPGAPASEGERPTLPAATLGLPGAAIEPLLARLLDALGMRLAEPAHTTLEAWRARDALQGRAIAWSGGHGRAEGIDGDGRLVVALEGGGRTTLGAGEVHLQAVG